jgi:lipid-binding SYLF domain-containing protein
MTTKLSDIISRCNETLEIAAKKIPKEVWKHSKGVAIINVTETGFVFSGQNGDGIVIKHNEDNTWGAPSALTFTGAGFGAVFGKGDKRILIFPMTERNLKTLTSNYKFELGGQFGLTAGPIGREASVGVDTGTQAFLSGTFQYVFSEGALIAAGVHHHLVDNLPNVNEAFYGKKVDSTELVMNPGTVEIPTGKGVEELHAKLTELSK